MRIRDRNCSFCYEEDLKDDFRAKVFLLRLVVML